MYRGVVRRIACGMTFRICTFNAQNRSGGVAFLERRIKPGLVFLQEARGKYWPDAFMPVLRVENRPVGATAIYSPNATIRALKEPLSSCLGSSSPGGTLTAAMVMANGAEPFVAVSVYARIDKTIAFWNAERLVNDLAP
jgi:hypothetical protein